MVNWIIPKLLKEQILRLWMSLKKASKERMPNWQDLQSWTTKNLKSVKIILIAISTAPSKLGVAKILVNKKEAEEARKIAIHLQIILIENLLKICQVPRIHSWAVQKIKIQISRIRKKQTVVFPKDLIQNKSINLIDSRT